MNLVKRIRNYIHFLEFLDNSVIAFVGLPLIQFVYTMQLCSDFCLSSPLTSFPHGSPACDVALCILQELVHRWGETDRLDGVGHGGWGCQLQQSYVMVHAGPIETWVNDDPLNGDDNGSHPRAQHRSQAHSPVRGAWIAVKINVEQLYL